MDLHAPQCLHCIFASATLPARTRWLGVLTYFELPLSMPFSACRFVAVAAPGGAAVGTHASSHGCTDSSAQHTRLWLASSLLALRRHFLSCSQRAHLSICRRRSCQSTHPPAASRHLCSYHMLPHSGVPQTSRQGPCDINSARSSPEVRTTLESIVAGCRLP